VKSKITKAPIGHHCTAELADWLAEMHLKMDEQRPQIEALRSICAVFGIVPGGTAGDLHP